MVDAGEHFVQIVGLSSGHLDVHVGQDFLDVGDINTVQKN